MDDITARLGLDTTPYRRALTGAKTMTQEWSQEVNKSAKRLAGDLAKTVGLVGLISGLRELIQVTEEASKTGETFGEKGWVSERSVGIITTFTSAIKTATNTTREFFSYLIEQLGRAARFWGAFTVTGNTKAAAETVKQMDREDAERMRVARRAAEEKDRISREHQANLKKEAELAKAAAEQERRAADNLKILVDRNRALAQVEKLRTELQQTKEDRSKFTLQELAEMQGRFGGRFGQEVMGARAVIAFMERARIARMVNRPDISDALQNRADAIRSQLTNLVSGERFPFAGLEESSKTAAENLKDLNRKASQEGLIVKQSMQ